MKKDGNVKIGKWGKKARKRPLRSFSEQHNKMLYPFRLNHQLDAMKRRKHERQFAGSTHILPFSARHFNAPSRVSDSSCLIQFEYHSNETCPISSTRSIHVCRSHPRNDDERRLCWWCCSAASLVGVTTKASLSSSWSAHSGLRTLWFRSLNRSESNNINNIKWKF